MKALETARLALLDNRIDPALKSLCESYIRLHEALEWYANNDKVMMIHPDGTKTVQATGQRAREALAEGAE